MRHGLGAILIAVLAVAGQAEAQGQDRKPPPAPPAKPAGKTVETVTVTGASPNGFRSDIDRKSYGIASDLQTTTGSVSDALRNIPSVEVDPQGTVSLRGDSNVTVLLDGKPSGQFKGASAGQALQAMPAESIERVEVITNPSAEFSPEGAAGIINLISKKVRKPGGSGSARISLGNHGRRQGAITAAYNVEKLTVSGDLNGRYDPQSGSGSDRRQVFDGQGRLLGASQTLTHGSGHLDRWAAHASIDYDLDPRTRLSGDARFSHFDADQGPFSAFQAEDPGGVAIQAFSDGGHFTWGVGDRQAQATLRRTFGADDHTLTASLSRERIDDVRDQAFSLIPALPPGATVFSDLATRNVQAQSELKADYVRPMPAAGKLKAGYDLRVDDNRYDNRGLIGASPGAAGPDPTRTNLFLYRLTVQAAYATYEQPFGDWTVLGGLRLEDARLDLRQVTTGQVHNTDEVRAYPSLHLADKLSDSQQLSFSYSRRVQRPNPDDLNPFPVQQGPLSFQAGNPDLKPQITDSFEAGYQYRAGATFYLATAYYRRNRHGATNVVTAEPGGVLLSTEANLSASQAAGLELVASGRLTSTLTYNFSTNLYWTEIEATRADVGPVIDFAARRQAFAAGGRGSLTWQPTPRDTVQLSVNLNAKRLTPQGFVEPFALAYLGYRHRFSDALFGVVTLQDPFQGVRFHQVTSTAILKDNLDQHIHIRGVFVGVTRTFGSGPKKPKEPGFDFGS